MGNPVTGEPSGTYRRKSLMDTMAVAPSNLSADQEKRLREAFAEEAG